MTPLSFIIYYFLWLPKDSRPSLYNSHPINMFHKGFFTDKSSRKLIICGDILDRGREALKVQTLIILLLDF